MRTSRDEQKEQTPSTPGGTRWGSAPTPLSLSFVLLVGAAAAIATVLPPPVGRHGDALQSVAPATIEQPVLCRRVPALAPRPARDADVLRDARTVSCDGGTRP